MAKNANMGGSRVENRLFSFCKIYLKNFVKKILIGKIFKNLENVKKVQKVENRKNAILMGLELQAVATPGPLVVWDLKIST